MNCAFDKEKLTGYYDGELEAAEKAEVERHIASCSECLRELGELKSAAILVKDLPRLRAPKSIAEGVSREIQAAGKVHQFAKVRRTILWASAVAAALFVGLNVMYFSSADKAAAPVAASAPPPAPVAKVQQEVKREEAKQAGEKEAFDSARRLAQDRAPVDESRNRELRKSAEEQKEQFRGRDDARKALTGAAPVERALEKEKSDGLAGRAPEPKPAAPAEPPAPAKPTAAPPSAAPAPVAKAPAAPPAPAAELAEKGAARENLARAESKKALDPAAVEAAATHLTLASTQVSKSRLEVESALKKMGVAMPPPAPAVRSMKAASSPDPVISLELTDAQIARLKQELNKPGASKILVGAPSDPVVLAEFGEGRLFGAKKESAAVASGGAGAAKAKDLGKADAKAEPAKDAKESKEFDAVPRGLTEGAPADKSTEPRRKVVLHLVEVPYVPDVQPAPDALKK